MIKSPQHFAKYANGIIPSIKVLFVANDELKLSFYECLENVFIHGTYQIHFVDWNTGRRKWHLAFSHSSVSKAAIQRAGLWHLWVSVCWKILCCYIRRVGFRGNVVQIKPELARIKFLQTASVVPPLYVANATICRNRHYMSQNPPLYVATLNVAQKSKIDTICRKLFLGPRMSL